MSTNKIKSALPIDRAILAFYQQKYTNIKRRGNQRFSQDDLDFGFSSTELAKIAKVSSTPKLLNELNKLGCNLKQVFKFTHMVKVGRKWISHYKKVIFMTPEFESLLLSDEILTLYKFKCPLIEAKVKHWSALVKQAYREYQESRKLTCTEQVIIAIEKSKKLEKSISKECSNSGISLILNKLRQFTKIFKVPKKTNMKTTQTTHINHLSCEEDISCAIRKSPFYVTASHDFMEEAIPEINSKTVKFLMKDPDQSLAVDESSQAHRKGFASDVHRSITQNEHTDCVNICDTPQLFSQIKAKMDAKGMCEKDRYVIIPHHSMIRSVLSQFPQLKVSNETNYLGSVEGMDVYSENWKYTSEQYPAERPPEYDLSNAAIAGVKGSTNIIINNVVVSTEDVSRTCIATEAEDLYSECFTGVKATVETSFHFCPQQMLAIEITAA